MAANYSKLKPDSNELSDNEEDIIFDVNFNRVNPDKRRKLILVLLLSFIVLFTAIIISCVVFYVHGITSTLSNQVHLSDYELERPQNKGNPNLGGDEPYIQTDIRTVEPKHGTDEPNLGSVEPNLGTDESNQDIQTIGSYQKWGTEIKLTTETIATYENTTSIDELPLCLTNECVVLDKHLSNSMDLSVDYCDDFYSYACGNWKRDNPVPIGKSEWDFFDSLDDLVKKQILRNLEQISNDTNEPSSFSKLRSLYHSCMNKDKQSWTNIYSSLNSEINDLGGWPSLNPNWTYTGISLDDLIIKSIEKGYYPLFKIDIIKDKGHSDQDIIIIKPMEVSENIDTNLVSNIIEDLSRRYFKNDIDFNFRYFYQDDIISVKRIYNRLSDYSSSTTIDSPPYGLRYKVRDLAQITPTIIDMKRILMTLFSSIDLDTEVLVQNTGYFDIIKNIGSVDNRTIANYFCTTFTTNFIKYMGINKYFIKTSSKENSNNCYKEIQTLLPNLFGVFYANINLNETDIKYVSDLVDSIQESFIETLKESVWLDLNTKSLFTKKVENIRKFNIEPAWTIDKDELDHHYNMINVLENDYFYSMLSVLRGKHIQNVLLLNLSAENKYRDMWPECSTTEVNAYYFRKTNEICIPAGLAQPPLFGVDRPMVFNLAQIGYFVGHEFTHSLDTRNIVYNWKGDYWNPWGEDSPRRTYYSKAYCFENQYSKYETTDGSETLNENIADNGGLRLAYRVFKEHQKNRVEPFKRLPRAMKQFTEEQLFFITFANEYSSSDKYDNHSPDPIRVKGTLANFKEFAKAFNCGAGTTMNPVGKCDLW